jgi:DNA-directed RNA polymerase specialized sigma24 family protein
MITNFGDHALDLRFCVVVLSLLKLNTGRLFDSPTDRPAHADDSAPQSHRGQRRLRRVEKQRITELYVQGLSAREVAAEMGIAKTTVLRALHATQQELRPQGVRYR